MSTRTVNLTSWINVPGNSARLHSIPLQNFDMFDTISVSIAESGLQWNFVGYDQNGGYAIDRYWYNSGNIIDISGESRRGDVVSWELWIKYTGGGSIDPSAITTATCTITKETSGWYIGSDGIDNTEFLPDYGFMEQPFPLSIWQCDESVDSGMAYCPLFPDSERIDPRPVSQIPYIRVYDQTTPQAELEVDDNNGLAILIPAVCEDHETLCGMWEVNLEHPIDPEGRWQLIQQGNLLRVNGQLFTIKKTEEVWQGNSGKVTAYAECIWYQWTDEWIFASPYEPVKIYSKNGNDAIGQIKDALTEKVLIHGGVRYNFRHSSDMVYDSTYLLMLEEGTTPVELILGEKGLIAQKGGELHRNNFDFSVNSRKEGARDNAFDIRIGKNLKGIKRTVDTTTMCTYYRLIDSDTGMWYAAGWDTQFPGYSVYFPHHVVRSELVSYPADTDFRFDRLAQEMLARFDRNCMPTICYEIDMEDVRNNPDFAITADEDIRVGDIGRVYDERLGGTIMLEVTETVYDRVRNRCTSITVGQKQSFVYHPNSPVIWDTDGEPIQPDAKDGEIWVSDSDGVFLYDADGVKIVIDF